MLNQQELGQRICRLREREGISRTDFAQSLMVTPQAVGKWERGESLPDIIMLASIARLLSTDLNTLCGFEADDAPPTTQAWDMSMSNWVDADFTALEGVGKKFVMSNIERCIFRDAKLSGVVFKANNIKKTDFSLADLSGGRLTACNLSKCNLSGARLASMTIGNTSVVDCDMTAADLSGAKLRFCSVMRVGFSQARLVNTTIEHCLLADLTIDTDIADCTIQNTTIKNVVFQGMHFSNTFFKNVKLKNVSFVDCTADKISYSFLAQSKQSIAELVCK